MISLRMRLGEGLPLKDVDENDNRGKWSRYMHGFS
jgi:hypothetical protein